VKNVHQKENTKRANTKEKRMGTIPAKKLESMWAKRSQSSVDTLSIEYGKKEQHRRERKRALLYH